MGRSIRQATGIFLALLALLAQLATAVAAMPPAASALADATMLCAHDAADTPPAAPANHPPACPLCVFCHVPATPVGLPAAVPVPPAPRIVWLARAALPPPATAPPRRVVLAARPRGPPFPV